MVGKGSSAYGDTPHTYGMSGCGEGGLYVHMTPDLIKDSIQKGFGKLSNFILKYINDCNSSLLPWQNSPHYQNLVKHLHI